MARACEIVEPFDPQERCKAPPAGEESHTKATCFACGLLACTNCSRRRTWMKYGRQRICFHCDQDEKKVRKK